MTRDDLALLDQKLHQQVPMPQAECVRWIGRLRDALQESRNGNRALSRLLAVLKNLFEKKDGAEAATLQLLREHKLVEREKPKEPPVAEKREEFIEVYRNADAKGKRRLEAAAEAGGDAVLLGMVELEKGAVLAAPKAKAKRKKRKKRKAKA